MWATYSTASVRAWRQRAGNVACWMAGMAVSCRAADLSAATAPHTQLPSPLCPCLSPPPAWAAADIQERLQREGLRGRTVTLRLMKRRAVRLPCRPCCCRLASAALPSSPAALTLPCLPPRCWACTRLQGAPEPRKFMGHGVCDNLSRSGAPPALSSPPAACPLLLRPCLPLACSTGRLPAGHLSRSAPAAQPPAPPQPRWRTSRPAARRLRERPRRCCARWRCRPRWSAASASR